MQAEFGEEAVSKFLTVKSQLEPKLEPELDKMRKQLRSFESRVRRGEERRRGGGKLDIGEIKLEEEHVRKGWEAERKLRKGCMTVQQVEEVKKKTRGLVVAPVDKCSAEAVFI